MHHMLTEEAELALEALEHGAVMNTTHRVARELIAAGLAFDGWGKLEISETGRRASRAARFETPANSHPATPFELPPLAGEPVKFTAPHMRSEKLTWSRERAARAAGAANGATDCWVEPRWVAAFMDAYEAQN